ncbi:MAG: tetratricopeptide repeat protein [Chrysiogenetes bacterium]|nr:tetratricopeptide repeat protein [Chrysiogenetes bacterium]
MIQRRTLALILLFLGLSLQLPLARPARAADLDRIEQRMMGDEGDARWMRDQDLEELRGELNEALNERPNSTRALILRGIVHMKLRRLRSARADFEQAVRGQPRNALAHYNLALALERLGQYGDARDSYERAVLLDAGLAPAQYNLGRIYENSGDPKRAESAYYAAWLALPKSTRILNSLGNVRFKQGDYRGAMIYYDEAKATAPGSGIVLHNRALTLEYLQRYEDALVSYQEATEASPKWEDPRLGLARCAYRLNKWDKAEEALAPILEAKGKDGEQARLLHEAVIAQREGRPVPGAKIETPEEPAQEADDAPAKPEEK